MDVNTILLSARKLAAIADAYDANELDDEARKYWGLANEHENQTPPGQIELYTGRGGKTLLTLEDALSARKALEHEIPEKSPLLRYRLIASWNGAIAVDALCTASMAHSIIHVMRKDFMILSPKSADSLPRLDDILKLELAGVMHGVLTDNDIRSRSTGYVNWIITRET